MSLKKIIETWIEPIYQRPPPIRVVVLAINSGQQVVRWNFEGKQVMPAVVQGMQQVAVTDGHMVTTFTLTEELNKEVQAGRTYFIRGYSLRGPRPPHKIQINTNTQFFRSSPMPVPGRLFAEASALLSPPSTKTDLQNVWRKRGYLTVTGWVKECSPPTKVRSDRSVVPNRRVTLQQGCTEIGVILWRDSVLGTTNINSLVEMSHLKVGTWNRHTVLHSTPFTKVKTIEEGTSLHLNGVQIMGVLEVASGGLLEIALKDQIETFVVDKKTWEPLEESFSSGDLYVDVEISAHRVISLKKSEKIENVFLL